MSRRVLFFFFLLFDAVLGGDSLASTAFGADEIRELLGLEKAIPSPATTVSAS